MKKIIVLAATLLLALGFAQAQDTLVTRTPKSTYFCYPEYHMDSTWFLQASRYGFTPYGGAGKYFCLELGEELNIYGIDLQKQLDELKSNQ